MRQWLRALRCFYNRCEIVPDGERINNRWWGFCKHCGSRWTFDHQTEKWKLT